MSSSPLGKKNSNNKETKQTPLNNNTKKTGCKDTTKKMDCYLQTVDIGDQGGIRERGGGEGRRRGGDRAKVRRKKRG